MDRVTLVTILTLSSLIWSPASAQQGSTSPVQTEIAPSVEIITTAPNQTSARQVYFQSDLDEATEGIRRTRIALISTSAVFGVGIILASIGASQCTAIDTIDGWHWENYICNNAGDVLVPLGGSFLMLGSIGMITSGIMLGVRKGKRRRMQQDMRRSTYGGRLQWDVESARLVF
jgi:hypothetical protein